MALYLATTDRFMSGWGESAGRTNRFVVECDTREELDTVERNARRRSEMSRITVCLNRPRSTATRRVDVTHYRDLGPVWKKA